MKKPIAAAARRTGVTLVMFLGYGVIGQLAMALLPIQIAVAVWLMVKGFEECHLRIHTEAHEA